MITLRRSSLPLLPRFEVERGRILIVWRYWVIQAVRSSNTCQW